MKIETRLYHPLYSAMRWIARRAPFVRRLVPVGPFIALRDYLSVRAIGSLPDRRYLENTILPAIATVGCRRVLFVGCKRYTRHYARYFTSDATEYWTADWEPGAAIWGAGDRHFTCDVRTIDTHVSAGFFDVVIMNGVFGFGVNDEPSMNQTVGALHRVLVPEGRLLIGWDKGLTPDPAVLPDMPRLFRAASIASLPVHKSFAENGHIYDCFVARPVQA